MIEMDATRRQELAEYWYDDDVEKVDAIIAMVENGAEQVGFGPFVDSFEQSSYPPVSAQEFDEMTIVIPELTPQQLTDSFGEAAIIWAAVHAHEFDTSKAHYQAIPSLTGHDPKEVKQSVQWSISRFNNKRTRNVLLQLALTEFVTSLDDIDVPTLVQQHPADGVDISAKRADKYGLEPLQNYHTEGHVHRPWPNENTVIYDIHLQEPVGAALTYNDFPIAFAGFGAVPDNEIAILQLHGVTGKKLPYREKLSPRGLAPLDWHGLFIHIAEIAAHKAGADSIGIRAPGRSGLKHADTTAQKVFTFKPTIESFARAYHEPARNHGFTHDELGYWHRPL